jgi:hypothetical protein
VTRAALPPLEPELESLLDKERLARPPVEALDRVWTRLATSVAVGAPWRDETPGPAAGAGGEWLKAHAKAAVVAAFVGGAAAGAALVVSVRSPPRERIVYVERSVEPPVSAAEHATTLADPAAASKKDPQAASDDEKTGAVSPPATRRPAAPSASASLAAERSLLDDARSALAKGDSTRALALTDAHVRRFVHPQLAEEREALAVQALVGDGRYDDARSRAAHFRTTWPSSLFLPAVDASLSSIP